MLQERIIDDWYLTVRCKNCDTEFPFSGEDTEPDPLFVTTRAEMVLTCPECKFPMLYSGEHVLRVQARG